MFYIYIIFGIFLDLLSKYIAQTNLELRHNIIGNWLYFEYVENIGIAFSIPITGMILKVLTVGIICIIFWYYFTEEKKQHHALVDAAFGFILAGALGNAYERIFQSKVTDFIGIQYFSVFNLADVWITLGVGFYILHLFLIRNKK